MGTFDTHDEALARSFARLAHAREAWVLRAAHVPDALLKLGLVGRGDRLVMCPSSAAALYSALLPAGALSFASSLDPAAFVSASRMEVPSQHDEAPAKAARASYAHAAGVGAGHLFWYIETISSPGLLVADIRALAEEALLAGALLIVNNTHPGFFGCVPLEQGAHVVFEEIDERSGVFACAVARSVKGKGRRRRVLPAAQEAHLLLTQRLGEGAKPEDAPRPCSSSSCDTLARAAAQTQACMDHARAIAEYLFCHPAVSQVSYAGLKTHQSHACAERILVHGFGTHVEFELAHPSQSSALCAAFARESTHAPAHQPPTLLSLVDTPKKCILSLSAGVDDPLGVIDVLERLLRECT